jgi:hypothetical protein
MRRPLVQPMFITTNYQQDQVSFRFIVSNDCSNRCEKDMQYFSKSNESILAAFLVLASGSMGWVSLMLTWKMCETELFVLTPNVLNVSLSLIAREVYEYCKIIYGNEK